MKPRSYCFDMLGMIAVASVIVLMTGAAWAQHHDDTTYVLDIQNEPAYNNQQQTLRVTRADGEPVAGVYVHARYYPRTTIRRGELACKTGPDGTCGWTPQYAGLVEMRVLQDKPALTPRGILVSEKAKEQPLTKKTFSIRFEKVPLSGIAIFALAFFMLFGSLAWSMTELLYLAPKRQAATNTNARSAS